MIKSQEGMNLQPLSASNPGGSDYVGIRQWQNLSYIWKRKGGSYGYIEDEDEANDRQWWIDHAPPKIDQGLDHLR